MLDVHPPHEPVHGLRDFLLHLFTITIGLLIALGLEGLVEAEHHRHLAHQAELSLSNEIGSSARNLPKVIEDLHAQQAALKHDVTVLDSMIKTGKRPERGEMSVTFRITSFDSVAWKTAQASGALSSFRMTRRKSMPPFTAARTS